MNTAPPRDGRPAAAHPPAAGRTMVWGAVVLLGTAAAVAAASLTLGRGHPGRPRAVAVAAGVCLPGALAAWLMARKPAANAASGVAVPLAATAVRMMPPLAALAWISSAAGGLRDAGAAPLLVVFYLALLAADILLHVGTRSPPGRAEKAPH